MLAELAPLEALRLDLMADRLRNPVSRDRLQCQRHHR